MILEEVGLGKSQRMESRTRPSNELPSAGPAERPGPAQEIRFQGDEVELQLKRPSVDPAELEQVIEQLRDAPDPLANSLVVCWSKVPNGFGGLGPAHTPAKPCGATRAWCTAPRIAERKLHFTSRDRSASGSLEPGP